jgi:hypothetical protein
MSSPHLDALIAHNHGSAHMQVVYIDIVQYSKRQSYSQSAVIREFTRLVNSTLATLIPESDAITGGMTTRDIVKSPTGEGIVIAFTFDEMPFLADQFVQSLEAALRQHNQPIRCQHFENTKWCNCHPYLLVKMIIREGMGIVYRDANGAYNIVGPSLASVSLAPPKASEETAPVAGVPRFLHLEL